MEGGAVLDLDRVLARGQFRDRRAVPRQRYHRGIARPDDPDERVAGRRRALGAGGGEERPGAERGEACGDGQTVPHTMDYAALAASVFSARSRVWRKTA